MQNLIGILPNSLSHSEAFALYEGFSQDELVTLELEGQLSTARTRRVNWDRCSVQIISVSIAGVLADRLDIYIYIYIYM